MKKPTAAIRDASAALEVMTLLPCFPLLLGFMHYKQGVEAELESLRIQ